VTQKQKKKRKSADDHGITTSGEQDKKKIEGQVGEGQNEVQRRGPTAPLSIVRREPIEGRIVGKGRKRDGLENKGFLNLRSNALKRPKFPRKTQGQRNTGCRGRREGNANRSKEKLWGGETGPQTTLEHDGRENGVGIKKGSWPGT